MGAFEAEFRLDGHKHLGKSLQGLLKAGQSPKPVLQAYGAHMVTIGARALDEQADPATGRKWKKPASGTLGVRPGGGSGGKALYDTGRLARSLSRRPRTTATTVTVGSNLPQARLLHHGGTIVPKNAKHLTQPLTREAVRSRGMRRWWTDMEKKGRRPFILKRGDLKLVMAPARAPKPASARKSAGKSAGTSARGRGRGRKAAPPKVQAHWKLVQKMTIPGRPFLGFGPRDRQLLNDMLRGHLRRSVQGGGKGGA